MPSVTDAPIVIRLSDEERDSGSLSDHHLYDAVEAFFNDGFVVVENSVDLDKIDRLNQRMLKDTGKLLAGEGLSHYAWVLFRSSLEIRWAPAIKPCTIYLTMTSV